jgi:CheY-like chemotaxis protein
VALARARHPALIFMDLVMPVMTGFEAVQALRNDPQTAHSLIIGASASSFDEDKRRSLQAGCDSFITKPIEMAQALQEMAQLLHLTWVYADELRLAPSVPEASPSSLTRPAAAILAEFRALALQGDLFGVEARAQALANTDAQYTRFAQKLIRLAQDFEDKQILELLL